MNIREAVVAGSFYPGTKSELMDQLDKLFLVEKDKIKSDLAEKEIIGAVIPHAGYIFSGYEAVHFFALLKKSEKQYDTIFIINPNHTGYGADIEVDNHDEWETPIGTTPLDHDFIKALDLPVAGMAQSREHSAEVILPFLQKWLEHPFKIVPVCILRQNPDTSREIAQKIFDANKQLKKKILVIASSDFSHYVDPESGAKKDDLVLKEIENLDSDKLHDTVIKNRISVCGYGPIMTLIEYAKLVSENPKSTILARGNSGKTMQSGSVVDYVSILFYQE
ncbi:MAG: AmmeMemoRadiSam system protein B [Bacteroidales bacterium]|nr:AmmeMemoRadiSam system protein B [Bacteroidales bacterium]